MPSGLHSDGSRAAATPSWPAGNRLTALVLLATYVAAQCLAARIDQARQDVGLNKNELARIASVSRPLVSRLINHAEVPGRKAAATDRDRARMELGKPARPGGGQPTLRGSALSAKVVAHRLEAIADEAEAAALESARQAERWRQIGNNARAAALLALRGGAAVASHRQNGVSLPPLDGGIMTTQGSDRPGMPGLPGVAGHPRGWSSTYLVEIR